MTRTDAAETSFRFVPLFLLRPGLKDYRPSAWLQWAAIVSCVTAAVSHGVAAGVPDRVRAGPILRRPPHPQPAEKKLEQTQ